MTIPDRTSSAPGLTASLLRIARASAFVLIALSLVAQLARLALLHGGEAAPGGPGLYLLFGLGSFAILPGILVALLLFLWYAARSIRHRQARLWAAACFIALLLPLAAGRHVWPGPTAPVAPVVVESPDFAAGRDWARQHALMAYGECKRSKEEAEFERGCRIAVSAYHEELKAAGRVWARENRPAKPSDCKGVPNFILGCRSWYAEHLKQPKPAGEGKYEGMTTAECQLEVNANYEVSEQLDRENGNLRSVEVTRRRHWLPELRDCENYDKLAAGKFMPGAYARLQAAVDELKRGVPPGAADRSAVLADFTAMSKIEDQPYKTAYFALYETYSRLLEQK